MVRLFCFLTLFSIAGIASSSDLANISSSSYSGKVRMVAPSGVVVELDRFTDRIYVADTSGSVTDYSIQEAINSSVSVDSERVRIRNSLNALMREPKYTFSIRDLRVATDDSHWPITPVSWCGDVICLIESSGVSLPKNSIMSFDTGGDDSCNHYLCPVFPCFTGPCVPHATGSKYLYSAIQAGWGKDQGGGNIPQQEEVMTRRDFHRLQKQEACSAMPTKAATVVGASAVAVGGCITLPTNGGLACAGGVVLYAASVKDFIDTVDSCYSDYVPLGQ